MAVYSVQARVVFFVVHTKSVRMGSGGHIRNHSLMRSHPSSDKPENWKMKHPPCVKSNFPSERGRTPVPFGYGMNVQL